MVELQVECVMKKRSGRREKDMKEECGEQTGRMKRYSLIFKDKGYWSILFSLKVVLPKFFQVSGSLAV